MLLKCLSIQQPWADLIISGKKRVENRTWRWMARRNWQQDGSVPLAIHASGGLGTWRGLSEKERDQYLPEWRANGGPGQWGLVRACVRRPRMPSACHFRQEQAASVGSRPRVACPAAGNSSHIRPSDRR